MYFHHPDPPRLCHVQEEHIKVIISILEKHGRDPKVLDVLRSLCVGNGVAVRSSQNNICDYLLPGKSLLLQTALVDHVSRSDATGGDGGIRGTLREGDTGGTGTRARRGTRVIRETQSMGSEAV